MPSVVPPSRALIPADLSVAAFERIRSTFKGMQVLVVGDRV